MWEALLVALLHHLGYSRWGRVLPGEEARKGPKLMSLIDCGGESQQRDPWAPRFPGSWQPWLEPDTAESSARVDGATHLDGQLPLPLAGGLQG